MAVSEQKLLTLIDSLINATRAEKVEWTSTKARSAPAEDMYSLSLTRGTVNIWSQDGDGAYPFMLEIRGDQGQVVEAIRSTGGGQVADGIAELFRTAMNSARNANAVIDSIIEDLADPI